MAHRLQDYKCTVVEGAKMIRISQHQIDMVKTMREDQYRARICRFVVNTFPELCREIPPEILARIVTRALQLGASYDITDKQDLQRFVGYHFLLHEGNGDLCRLPWIRQILKDRSLKNGAQRMMVIDSTVRKYIEARHGKVRSADCS